MSVYDLNFIKEFLNINYSEKQIKSIIPYAFTVGSDNQGEGLSLNYSQARSLFYGFLYLSVNPNDNVLQNETIKIRYRSYFNDVPFYKHISRYVEQENLINENSSSLELFDELTVTQSSTKYDFYLSFIGFKIDVL